MHERFIAISLGYWGKGNTIDAAKSALRKAGGKSRGCVVWKFTSELPFAPNDRDATEDETDCWVSRDGMLVSIRAKREIVEQPKQKKPTRR